MTIRALLASLALAVAAASNAFAADLSYADIAGKWSGINSRGVRIDLAIDATGKFSMNSPQASSSGVSGQAVIQKDDILLAFNNGKMNLKKVGKQLKGQLSFLNRESDISFDKQ